MKRKISKNPVSEWKKAFTGSKETVNTPITNPSREQNDPKAEGTSLTFIKKMPVTFRVSRMENPNEFERVLFVCKARSVNIKHPFTSVVHVEWSRTGTRLVASDGQRLHVTEIKARIPRGDYKPAVTKKTIIFGEPVEGIVFPNWKNIIPEAAINKGTLNLSNTGIGKNPKLAAGLSLVFNELMKKTGEVINLRYLDDLPKKEWNVRVYKDIKTVILLEEKDAAKETFAVFVPLSKVA
jgi:hypothetical protein